jgi:potassium-transporting ATPase KdpC subunit
MLTDLRRGVVALATFTVLVGLAYPLLLFGIGQAAFRGGADGSLVTADGRVVGSRLIGQSFDAPGYFWGRPTAADIPAELVTASGSGLDPDISPAAAQFQVRRVAAARRLDPERVRALVRRHTQGRALGFLGEPRVNVLQLNLALDTLTGR